MKNFTEKLSNAMMPLVNKVGAQKHLCAIRDGFIAAMPIIITASVFVLINNVVLDPKNGIFKNIVDLGKYKEIGNQIYNGTLGILAIVLAFTIAYKLAQSYNEDGLHPGIISVTALVTMLPSAISITPVGGTEPVQISGVLSQVHTSSTGLFLTIIAALVGTEIFLRLSKNEKIKIRMPETVPYGVAKSFNVLVPSILTLSIIGIFVFIINIVSNSSIPDLVTKIIQAPVQGIVEGAGGMLFITFLQNLLWAFGLHGSSILGPLVSPALLSSMQQNMDAYQAGAAIPNIVTESFINVYSVMGGGGCTIGLIIAIFLVSKRADYKQIAKLSSLPGAFNINEPIMFGLPVVLNPILAIPVVLVPAINLSLAYFATSVGFIDKTVALVPWTTPPVLSAFLATGGDFKAGIFAAGLVVLSVLIYIPFVIACNNQD